VVETFAITAACLLVIRLGEVRDTIVISVSHRHTVHQFHHRHVEPTGDGQWRLGRFAAS
jgi:ABC-type uncharacterized transport system fused permease/ATPase subunit